MKFILVAVITLSTGSLAHAASYDCYGNAWVGESYQFAVGPFQFDSATTESATFEVGKGVTASCRSLANNGGSAQVACSLTLGAASGLSPIATTADGADSLAMTVPIEGGGAWVSCIKSPTVLKSAR